jgi:hypothetical protein
MTKYDDRQERQGILSFLEFWFFQHGKTSPVKIKLPFIENIDVKESQKANLVKYQPLGRAGSLFTYTGAESRKLKLSFNFTFDNVDTLRPEIPQTYMGGDIWDENKFFETPQDISSDAYTAFSGIKSEQSDNNRDDRTTQIVMYWVNLIRSSVLNNVEDPTLPPPLIRLSHGTMYRNVPCICHGFNISHEENAGYERASFLPRRIKVSMDLSEVRLDQLNSDSGFKDNSVLTEITTGGSDRLKGWESIIRGESLDPSMKTVVSTLKGESVDVFDTTNPLGGLG